MIDRFSGNAPSLTAPASHAFAITPADNADLPEVPRALYCGHGGNIAATMASGAALTFTNLPDGALLPIRLSRIAATGTTASGLVGLV